MINTNYSMPQVDAQKYNTQPNFMVGDHQADLYPQSNILDIGDIADFEHVDSFDNNVDSQGIGESIKGFVKNIFGGLFG